MKTTAIKARWASKLMKSKSFIVIADTESIIFSPKTNAGSFTDYISAHQQLATLAKFQTALNKVVSDFKKQAEKEFGETDAKGKKRATKINVKVAK